MRTFLWFFFLLGAWSAVCAAPADLTPRPFTVNFDGVRFHRVAFQWGGRRIEYQPPQDWEASGSSERAYFKGKGESAVRMEITHAEGTPPPAWDEPGLNDLRRRATAVLPQVPELKLIDEQPEGTDVDGNNAAQYTFSGILYAQKYRFLVVLVPLKDEQFHFILYAPENEFEKAAKKFLRSLNGFRAQ